MKSDGRSDMDSQKLLLRLAVMLCFAGGAVDFAIKQQYVSAILFAIVALFFLYSAWQSYKKSSENRNSSESKKR